MMDGIELQTTASAAPKMNDSVAVVGSGSPPHLQEPDGVDVVHLRRALVVDALVGLDVLREV
jgi:hypothetical protein